MLLLLLFRSHHRRTFFSGIIHCHVAMFSIKPISHRMPRTADVKNVPEKNLKNVKNAKTLQKYFLNVLKR